MAIAGNIDIQKTYRLTEEEKFIIEVAKHANEEYLVDKEQLVNIDLNVLLEKALEQRIYPLIYKSIKPILPREYQAIYGKYYMAHMIDIKIKISEAAEIISNADAVKLTPCIAKGFVLSQITYDSPYMRQISDIDILITEDKIVDMCRVMENAGYTDELVKQLENEVQCKIDLAMFYLTRSEVKFVSESKKNLIEVKSRESGINKVIMEHFMNNAVEVQIGGLKFRTFDLIHTCLLLMTNTYKNFYTDYGICSDYTLRDLVDVYCFLHKHTGICYKLLYETANMYDMIGVMKYVLSLVENVFGSFAALDELNKYIENVMAPGDVVPWKSELLFRLLNKNERINERYISKIHSVMNNKLGTLPIKQKSETEIIKNRRICQYKLNTNLRFLYEYFDEMYMGFFIYNNFLYISFNLGKNLKKIPIVLKLYFVCVKDFSEKNITIDSSDISASIRQSDIDNVEIIPEKEKDNNTLLIRIPISNDLYIINGAERKILTYTIINKKGYEHLTFNLFSIGGKFHPMQLII